MYAQPLLSVLTGVSRRISTISAVLLAVLFAGLVAVPALAAEGAKASTPKIEIVSTGQGDKRELRFTPQVGSTQTVDFTMAMSMKMDGPIPMDMDLPGMRLGMKTTVTKVSDDVITYDIEIVDAGVAEDADPNMKAMVEQQTQTMVGTKGTVTIDPTGKIQSSQFTAPPNAPPDIVNNLQQSMDGSNVALPDQAVGTGASWTRSETLEENGVIVSQVTTYTVKELTDKGVLLGVSVKQSGNTGPIDDPTLPEGATATIDEFAGKGEGTTRYAFSHPMISESDLKMGVKVVTTRTLPAEPPAEDQSMTVTMEMGVSTIVKKR